MSENYPSDVKLNENQDGTVSFATEVVATIAGLAATEVDGVASMSSPSSGFADMFTRKNTRNFTKGVRIDLEGNKVVGSKITIQMAKDEGWIDKSGSKWKTMPEQMLMYRAGAFFARVHCPDVLYGVQMAEEVKDTYGYDENEKPKVTIEI